MAYINGFVKINVLVLVLQVPLSREVKEWSQSHVKILVVF